MSNARKRRKYVRWLRYADSTCWQFAPCGPFRSTPRRRPQGIQRAGTALYRIAPNQQVWLWVELS